jgi:hypothetical protein
MNRHFLSVIFLISLLIPAAAAETTTDYQPVDETIVAGSTTGFGNLADNDGSNWVGTETGSPMTLNITHDLDTNIAFGDLVYVEVRIRGFNSGEAFTVSARDWQDNTYVALFVIGAAVGTEQLFTESLEFVCGSGALDCLVNPNRGFAVAVSLRWNDAGGADAVASTLTIDQEIVRFVKTEQSSSSGEWTLRIGFVMFVLLLAVGFAAKAPIMVLLAGIILVFLSFSVQQVTESISLFIIFLFGGLMLIIIGAIATAAGGAMEA